MHTDNPITNFFSDLASRINDNVDSFLTGIAHFLNDLLSSNSTSFPIYAQVALYATLVASLVTIGFMLYVRPRRWLDKAYFAREIGISIVLTTTFLLRIFHWYSRPILLIGWTVLFLSALAILFTLRREHTFSQKRIEEVMGDETYA